MKALNKLFAIILTFTVCSVANAATGDTVQMNVTGSIVDLTCTLPVGPVTEAFGQLDSGDANTTRTGTIDLTCSNALGFNLTTTKTDSTYGATSVVAYLCLSTAPIVGDCTATHDKHFSSTDTDNVELGGTGTGAAQTYHYAITIANPSSETVADLTASWDVVVTPI